MRLGTRGWSPSPCTVSRSFACLSSLMHDPMGVSQCPRWLRTQRMSPVSSEVPKSEHRLILLRLPRKSFVSTAKETRGNFLFQLISFTVSSSSLANGSRPQECQTQALSLPLGPHGTPVSLLGPSLVPQVSYLSRRDSLGRSAMQHYHAFDGNLPSLRILFKVFP